MKTINNLDELLDGERPYHYGRSLCGPWIVYIMQEKPAYKRFAEVIIGKKNGKLAILSEIEQVTETDNINEDDRQFLGFEGGKAEKGILKTSKGSIKGYLKMVQDFIADKNHGNKHVTILSYDAKHIQLQITEDIKEVTRDVSYEDKEANGIDTRKCIGIKIGSIVEGSDVEVGPYELMFPFTDKDFDDTVKSVNDEACFYWDRDNSTWLIIKKDGKDVGWVKSTWGDLEFEKSIPRKVRNSLKKMIDFWGKEDRNIPNCKGYTYEESESMACMIY